MTRNRKPPSGTPSESGREGAYLRGDVSQRPAESSVLSRGLENERGRRLGIAAPPATRQDDGRHRPVPPRLVLSPRGSPCPHPPRLVLSPWPLGSQEPGTGAPEFLPSTAAGRTPKWKLKLWVLRDTSHWVRGGHPSGSQAMALPRGTSPSAPPAPHGRRPFASGAGVRARSVWISSHRERGDRISAAGPRQTALTTRHFEDSRPRAGEPRGPPPEASAELENSRQPHVPAELAHGKTLPPEPWITVGREPRTGLGRTRQTHK